MHSGGPWKVRGCAVAAVALALVLFVPVLAPAAGAATGRPAFAAARHRKHHAHHSKHHTHHAKHAKKPAPTVNAAAVQQRAAAARAAAARKAAKPRPKAHKAKPRHKRAHRARSAILLAVAARMRAQHAAQRRHRKPASSGTRKSKKAKLSAAGVTTMPSPLRIAALALLALLPFALMDGWLIWTDRRRRRVPSAALAPSEKAMRPKFRPKSWRRDKDA